ncbi:MAG: response regulator transcription factor [Elusimicrobia bacterium]|nr:response regulator transcription factor [Elusimicrobiota bacterium]
MMPIIYSVLSDNILTKKWQEFFAAENFKFKTFKNLLRYEEEIEICQNNIFSIIEIHPEICSYEKAEDCLRRKKGVLFFAVGSIPVNDSMIADLLLKGADDYIILTIAPRVLAAKIFAYIRRIKLQLIPMEEIARTCDRKLEVNLKEMFVAVKHKGKIKLTKKEAAILYLLVSNENKIVNRESILRTIWKEKAERINSQTLDKYIEFIRKKLDSLCGNIKTIYGRGYMYKSEIVNSKVTKWGTRK